MKVTFVLTIYYLGNLTHFLGTGALPEAVLEPASHGLEVTHAAGSGCAPALGLLTPVVRPDLALGVSAHGALLLLDVVTGRSAATADGVRLVVALSERGGSLSHCSVLVWRWGWFCGSGGREVRLAWVWGRGVGRL